MQKITVFDKEILYRFVEKITTFQKTKILKNIVFGQFWSDK